MNEVTRIYNELKSVGSVLKNSAGISELTHFSSHENKILLLASASYFERRICECILEFVGTSAPDNKIIKNFIENQALARKYHTLFDWNANNAKAFFKLFGESFATWALDKIKTIGFESNITSFLFIGSKRNQLIHQNYATYNLDATIEEIFERFTSALVFVDWLPTALSEFNLLVQN